jgi:hypothetical protein
MFKVRNMMTFSDSDSRIGASPDQHKFDWITAAAEREARAHGHTFIAPAHIALALLRGDDIGDAGLDDRAVRQRCISEIVADLEGPSEPRSGEAPLPLTSWAVRIFRDAETSALADNRVPILPYDVLHGILINEGPTAATLDRYRGA